MHASPVELKKKSRQQAFLSAYVKLGSLVAAVRETGIARACHYTWLKESQNYKSAFNAIEEECKRPASCQRTPEDEDRLRLMAQQFLSATRAPNTVKSYRYAWKWFCTWCEVQGHCSLPADEDTVLVWATSLIAAGRKVSTAASCVAAVAFYHRKAAHATPVGDKVRSMLAGARRTLRQVPRQKRALTPAELRLVSTQLDCGDPLLVRDRAIIMLGFAGGFRRSELRNLNMDDIEFVDQGLVAHLRYSKTDQEGHGRDVAVFRGDRADTCPIRALERWLKIRGRDPGPLFLPTRGGSRMQLANRRIAPETVRQMFRRGFAAAGLDPRVFSAHSVRAGYVTAAAENGASVLAIMRQTGHKSAEMVQRYFRPADAFKSNPLKNLL